MTSVLAPSVSIVVPCYRSERTVGPLLERIDAVLGALGRSYEVIFVDDDSPDGLGLVLDRLHEQNPERVAVVHLLRNAGQHVALMAGLHRARGEVVVTMDDDLQHPPEEIPRLLEALGPEIDVVYGGSESRKHAGWRNLGSTLVRCLMTATIDRPRGLVVSSFRAMRRETVQALVQSKTPYLFLEAEILRVTRRTTHVWTSHHVRAGGRSGYTIGRLLRLTMNLVFNHSALPLRVISALGIAAAVGAVVYGARIILRSLLGYPQQLGWPSLAVLIMFFGGATLFALGVIGEYLIRIVHQTTSRPQFHVRSELLPSDKQTSLASDPASGLEGTGYRP